MAKQVTIRISATDEFSTVINKYNTAVGGAASKSAELDRNSRAAQGGVSAMAGAIGTGLAVIGTLKMAEFVGDVVKLGDQKERVSKVFAALTASVGEGDVALLERLREATGGIVDDMTLMQGSNKLIQMGLAGNPDELANMTELAIKLGGAMGMDPTKAMDDFSLMLANQSIMRLDQFGISGAKVRREIEALVKTGQAASREEAFKLAVMDIGAEAMERLGSAANAASTPLARLETRIANFAQEKAGNVAIGFNAVIGLAEIAAGQNPIQVQQRESARAAAQTFVDEYYPALMERLSARSAGGFGRPPALLDPDMLADIGSEAGKAYIQAVVNEVEMGTDIGTALFRVTGISPDTPTGQAIVSGIRETMRAADEAAAQELASGRWWEMMTGITNAPGELWTQGEGFLNAILTTAQESGVLEDRMKTVADEAERAQKAFENMKLADVFGTTAGGMGGEITDLVIKQMQDMGAAAEQIAAMQRQLDLQSGRENTGSLFMKETLVPMMAGMTPEQAAAFQANMTGAYQQVGMGQGMNVVQGGLGALLGMTQLGGIDFAGLTENLGGLLGIGEESPFATMSGDAALMDEAVSGVTETISGMNGQLTIGAEQLTVMSDTLTDIEGVHEVEVRIKFSGEDLDTLKLLQGGAAITPGGSTLEMDIQKAGGRVPGASNRTHNR